MNCNNLIKNIVSLLNIGNIPETNLDIYFSNCKTNEDIIKKTINTLNTYYSKASLEEKYLINNLLFMLEILIDKNKALKNFIIRTLNFNFYHAYANEEGKKALNFLIYENYDKNTTFEAIKEILKNPSFYQIKNIVGIIWANKNFYANKEWLNLFNDMIKSLNNLIKQQDIQKIMPLHFIIYHTYGNNIQTISEWREFNKKVEIPTSKLYQKIGKKLNLKTPKKRVSTKKKKIGFIFDRLVVNSPFIIIYSLIKNLALNQEFNKNYEIYIYSLNYVDKHLEEEKVFHALSPFVKKIFTHNHKNIYYDHLQKAIEIREEIIKDKIDYLITMASGYDINNFIISNRSAPKQLFWSHGNCTFNIPNIDKRISHFKQTCKEFKWQIFNVPIDKEFLIGDEDSKKRAKILKETLLNQFGKETIFLGTIGRLIKLESEEYLKVLSKIMNKNVNTIYLACGSGNQKKVEKLMEKVGIDLKRVIFTGHVNPHLFGWIIDIWPDTFPLPHGNSRNEFEAKGGAIVGMKKYYPEIFIQSLENLTDKKLLAENEKEYIELTNKLIQDKNYRKEVGEIFKKRIESVNKFDVNKFLNILK